MIADAPQTAKHTPPQQLVRNAYNLVFWPARNLILNVLERRTGQFGEARLLVCKLEAQPGHGMFSVRVADVVAL